MNFERGSFPVTFLKFPLGGSKIHIIFLMGQMSAKQSGHRVRSVSLSAIHAYSYKIMDFPSNSRLGEKRRYHQISLSAGLPSVQASISMRKTSFNMLILDCIFVWFTLVQWVSNRVNIRITCRAFSKTRMPRSHPSSIKSECLGLGPSYKSTIFRFWSMTAC